MLSNQHIVYKRFIPRLIFFILLLIISTFFLSTTISRQNEIKNITSFDWNFSLENIVVNRSSEACNNEMRRMRSNSTFWIAQRISPSSFVLSPRTPIDILNSERCLLKVKFSARLLYPSILDPTAIVPIAPPILSIVSGVYNLTIPEENIPKKDNKLDIRLEWGEWKEDGVHCGVNESVCTSERMAELNRGERYLGTPVEVDESSIVAGSLSEASLDQVLPCRNLITFVGFWNRFQFYPILNSLPCSLPSLTLPPIFKDSYTLDSIPIWIHLIGDSNLRNLNSRLAASFGSGVHAFHQAEPETSTTHHGTLQSIDLRSFSGEYFRNATVLPDLIISWTWWYQTSTDFESNAKELKLLSSETLYQFLKRSRMRNMLGKGENHYYGGLKSLSKTLRPSRLFISLGSHSPELTRLGTTQSLEILLSNKGVGSLLENTSTHFFTTTLVQSSFIPERFPHQDLIRNNEAIRSKNNVMMNRKELTGRVIDIAKMTEGITENWMKNENDAVHFREFVYNEWVKLIWSNLMD